MVLFLLGGFSPNLNEDPHLLGASIGDFVNLIEKPSDQYYMSSGPFRSPFRSGRRAQKYTRVLKRLFNSNP